MDSPAVVTHGLAKTPWRGSGPSWGQVSGLVDSAQHCQGWVHIRPILVVSGHLPPEHPKLPCCVSVWCGVVSDENR